MKLGEIWLGYTTDGYSACKLLELMGPYARVKPIAPKFIGAGEFFRTSKSLQYRVVEGRMVISYWNQGELE